MAPAPGRWPESPLRDRPRRARGCKAGGAQLMKNNGMRWSIINIRIKYERAKNGDSRLTIYGGGAVRYAVTLWPYVLEEIVAAYVAAQYHGEQHYGHIAQLLLVHYACDILHRDVAALLRRPPPRLPASAGTLCLRPRQSPRASPQSSRRSPVTNTSVLSASGMITASDIAKTLSASEQASTPSVASAGMVMVSEPVALTSAVCTSPPVS